MPYGSFNKTASQTAKSFDDLISIIAKNKSKSSAKDVAHNMLNSGSGSILIDGAKGLLKRTPKGRATNNHFRHMQHKLNDIDIRAGKKIHDTLSEGGGFGKKLGKAFVYEHEVPLKLKDRKPDKYMKVNVPMISAPFEHAKRVGLPFIGAAVAADKIMPLEEKKEKGGDTVKTADNSREVLMDKIASYITNKTESPATIDGVQEKRASELFSKASTMLKHAAEERKQMYSDMEKLANENKMLHTRLLEIERRDKAEKLAKEMNNKGMIKKADVEKKAGEIMLLDDDAFALLKQATDNVQIKNEKNGLDNLTFLAEDYNIKSSSKKTLADEIGEMTI